MPNITFTLSDNTSVDNLSITGKPAGVLVPLPLKPHSSGQTDYSGTYEYSSDSKMAYVTGLTEAPSWDTLKQQVATYGDPAVADGCADMIGKLIEYGFRVIVKAFEITASETTAALTEKKINVDIASSTDHLYEEFKSKNTFDIQFITTGVYANTHYVSTDTTEVAGCYSTLAGIAATRGDCIALVEFRSGATLATVKSTNALTNSAIYAAGFYPRCKFELSSDNIVEMPACFAYLTAYANATQSYPEYFAVAGISRGYAPGAKSVSKILTDAEIESIQNPGSAQTDSLMVINPITQIINTGIRIYGNRTTKKPAVGTTRTYTCFLNVMILVADIFKRLQASANACMFDPNDDVTWFKFTTPVNALLDDMKANRGITGYYWKKIKSVEKGKIEATLYIRPIEAVEDFTIGVTLVDDDGLAAVQANIAE